MALSPQMKAMVSGAKAKYSGGGGKAAKLKEGRNRLRIIAPTQAQADWIPATGQFWADLGVHWIKPSKDAKPMVVMGDCETVYQRPSAISTAIGMAVESALDEESKELFESWKPRRSVLVNALNRDGDVVDIFELTSTTFAKFLDIYELFGEQDIDVTDPATGVDIIITKTGTGLLTKYDVAAAPGTSAPLTADQASKAADLPAWIAKNFFRGEDQKALNVIQQIAGISVPQIGGPGVGSGAATPTAALTSAGATVAPEPEPAPVVPAGPTQAQIDAKALMDAALAAQKTAQDAATAAANAAAAATQPEPAPATTSSGVSAEDELALLDELNNLAEA